jgi:hypothetical protein
MEKDLRFLHVFKVRTISITTLQNYRNGIEKHHMSFTLPQQQNYPAQES